MVSLAVTRYELLTDLEHAVRNWLSCQSELDEMRLLEAVQRLDQHRRMTNAKKEEIARKKDETLAPQAR